AEVVVLEHVTGGVVGGGDEEDVGAVLGDRRERRVDVERQVGAPVDGDPPRVRSRGEEGVHRVAGHEPHGAAAGAAEYLEELLEDLVGSVGGPHPVRVQFHAGLATEVGGEIAAQGDGVAIRVAVQVGGGVRDGGGQVGHQRPAGRVRVLVGVELHRDVELGRTVGAAAPEVLAQRQVLDPDSRAGG